MSQCHGRTERHGNSGRECGGGDHHGRREEGKGTGEYHDGTENRGKAKGKDPHDGREGNVMVEGNVVRGKEDDTWNGMWWRGMS